MSKKLREWVTNQMESILGFSDPSLVQHIVMIENEDGAIAYLNDFFGNNSQLISEYVKRRFPKPSNPPRQQKQHFEQAGFPISNKGKKKGKNKGKNINQDNPKNQEPIIGIPANTHTAASLSAMLFGNNECEEIQPQAESKIESVAEPEPKVPMGKWARKPDIKPEDTIQFVLPEAYKKDETPKKNKRKKNKTHLTEASDIITLPGRHTCDCQAQKHDLIGNCLSCGRIVCAQEGEGECLFCGCKVHQSTLSQRSKSDTLLRAIEHKNRLLEYDQNSTRRTQVIDDETDYYRGVDEEKIREQRFGSQLAKKFTLDLDTENMEERTLDQFIDDEASKNPKEVEKVRENRKENLFFNEDLQSNRFIFKIKSEERRKRPVSRNSISEKIDRKSRVQDERLKEMYDSGTCLTMHQPWASLLIKGLKTHEGRVWNTAHRGRLWIHSSVKPPDDELIAYNLAALNMSDRADEFDWPVGCLLGFCTVTDVLPQDEYRTKYPNGPSLQPYVFICEDIHELGIKLQISGEHKLWKLPREMHQSARIQLHM